VGDPKYGKKGDRFRRMALHAMHLEFDHPYSGRRMIFDDPVPPVLLQLTAPPAETEPENKAKNAKTAE